MSAEATDLMAATDSKRLLEKRKPEPQSGSESVWKK
jgi:hypothetical protein